MAWGGLGNALLSRSVDKEHEDGPASGIAARGAGLLRVRETILVPS